MSTTGRHPVNVGHLVMGIAFAGLVGVWALIQGDVVGNGDVHWLLPVPWVLGGIAGLLATGLSSRRWTSRRVGWVGSEGHATAVADDADGTTSGRVDDHVTEPSIEQPTEQPTEQTSEQTTEHSTEQEDER